MHWLRPWVLVGLAFALRVCFFSWSLYQDANMIPKYTDIDYVVFSDAARAVSKGLSPYTRATYRYTPLLSWLLVPNVWIPAFGKFLFILGDLAAGWFMISILSKQLPMETACLYASTWLLNPFVAVISTRGSSEGILGAMVILMLHAATFEKYFLAGLFTGLAVHFKIYPVIYAPSILLSLGPLNLRGLVNKPRVSFLLGSALSFFSLTGLMYYLYGMDYLNHAWLHHVTRLDHRHNLSVYSTALYYASANPAESLRFEKLAFLPQLFISGVVIPLYFARKNLAHTMFLQTYIFVTFNKVSTSQYFVWYLVLLPFYFETLARIGRVKYAFLLLWVLVQASWLRSAYLLEFLGEPAFHPGLQWSTFLFFLVNSWGIQICIDNL